MMKVRDVVKMLEANGWRLARMRGSHRVYKHAVKPGIVVVPGNPGDELAIGTLREIYVQARVERRR
jgi:predicted RNA binding protein YcfA (HicA-like mRNA interferase family)